MFRQSLPLLVTCLCCMTCLSLARGDDTPAQRTARQEVDLAKVKFFGQEFPKDSLDSNSLAINASEASGTLPLPTVKGRTSGVVAFVVPIPETARSATLTYRIKLSQGTVHRPIIVAKNGLILFLANIEAAKMQGLAAETAISPEEWHRVAISLTDRGRTVEIDGKTVAQSSGPFMQVIYPIELNFSRDGGDPGTFSIRDAAIDLVR